MERSDIIHTVPEEISQMPEPEGPKSTPSPSEDEYYKIPVSRRTFLKIGAVAGVAALSSGGTFAVLKALGFGNTSEKNPTKPVATPPTHENLTPIDGLVVFGSKEQEVLLSTDKSTKWMPDGHISYFTTADGKRRYYLSGGSKNATYMLETDGSQGLDDALLTGERNLTVVFGPDANAKHRQNYAGKTCDFQTDKTNPSHRYGLYHGEERINNDSSTYTATVGLIESTDDGLTWTDKGPLIVGSEVLPPGQAKDGGPTGAGQPCAIYNPKDGYVHGLYIDWSANENIQHPDQLYKFRMKTNEDGTLGAVEYYTEGGYSTNFEPAKLKSVIPANEFAYTALPSLSWNTELNKWLCIGLCEKGFWQSTSDDLDNWTAPALRYDNVAYGAQYGDAADGGTWIYYPSLLSFQYPTSETTGATGKLMHSFTGDFKHKPHQPMALPFTIQTS